eukprot:TRINITY_DN2849_c2_g1_i1.p1 TRINITY_DN2849_c2_g1~~TRINITY_DN2849_c2_g1_i1.p1  ORF type:complete len:800 (+),score=158.27 TRINITY_DN2849_c2_g1_i1:104-2503(+)
MADGGAAVSSTRPALLNEHLKVHSYDGGSQRGRAQYDIRHVLTPLVDPFHSSGSGTKFNLVLESSEDFTLTHIFVAGPGARCSEPIRSGIIWASDSLPSVEESKRYDGLSEEEIQDAVKSTYAGAASADPNLPGPCAYFMTDASTREVEVELPKWIQGKHLLVKFLDTHGRQDHVEVGMLAFVGFQGRRAAEQVPIGPWMRRSVRQPKVHPSVLKSMFSSGGWVCDGRDVPGGCRSGMTDFHQTSVYTMTFRCTTTGFDLCEACAFDPSLGQVTEATVKSDIEALRDPRKTPLACSRLRNVLRRNWLATLPSFVDGGLFDLMAEALKQPGLALTLDPEIQQEGAPAEQADSIPVGSRVEARYLLGTGRITSRFYAGRVVGRNDDGSYQVDYDDGDKWYNVPQELVVRTGSASGGSGASGGSQAESKKSAFQQALRSAMLELAQRLFSPCPAGLAVGDQVWARKPGSKWEEARLLALPSPLAKLPELGSTAETVQEGCGYQVCWRDGRQTSWVRPSDVLKAALAGKGAMAATVGVFSEVAKGPACDQAALSRHLQRGADLLAVDGLGYPALLVAVATGTSTEALTALLDAGIGVEASGAAGLTAIDQARLRARSAAEASAENTAMDETGSVEELLVSRGALAELPSGLSPEEQLRRLRESFGRRLLEPILNSHSASAMPTELLEVLELLVQGLDLKVLVEGLKPGPALRALSGLLQHFVGGADGVKTALMGCRICRALLAKGEEAFLSLVQSHGVLRWARWLASRKPTGPPPSPPRGSGGISSLLSAHQQQQHQQHCQHQ